MTWWVALSSGIGLLLVLLFLGIPVFVAFLILNVAGILLLMGPAGFGLFANSIYTTATITALATVPLFIVMGEILFRSGAMEAVFDSLDRLIGRIRGRQYVLCILLSAILGALSGAAMAVAGLLGRSLLPDMLRRGYNRRLSAGAILAGACLDPIIPPSVLAILIATLAEISTATLLIAGIIPGLLLMCLFLIYVLYRVWRDPSLAPELSTRSGRRQIHHQHRRRRGCGSLPCAFVFFMVMGLIMFGVATPTEAAATGVFGALVVAVIYGKFSLRMIWECADRRRDRVRAAARHHVLRGDVQPAPDLHRRDAGGCRTGRGRPICPPIAMLFLMMALPFVLFMFLDQLALMLVLIPIYQPLLKFYAFDPIWFWTLFLIVATVGGLTPPFGYVLFALKSAAPQSADNGDLPGVLAVRLADRARHGDPGHVPEPGDLPAQSHAAGVNGPTSPTSGARHLRNTGEPASRKSNHPARWLRAASLSTFRRDERILQAAALEILMAGNVDRFLGGSPLAVLFKLVLLSILIGVVLSALGLDPLNIFYSIERLIRTVWDMGFDAVRWLWRYFLLGAVIVIPVWLILRIARAPRGR